MYSEKDIVPLACRNCGRGLRGLPHDLLLYCPHCMIVWILDGGSLEPVGLDVVGSVEGGADLFLPFWRLETVVEVRARITRQARTNNPNPYPREFIPAAERGLQEGSSRPSPMTLLIPAFACARSIRTGIEVTKALGALAPSTGRPGSLTGGVVSRAEAFEIARGLVMTMESESGADAAFLEVSVTPVHASVAAVAAVALEKGVQLAGLRHLLPYNALPDSTALVGGRADEGDGVMRPRGDPPYPIGER